MMLNQRKLPRRQVHIPAKLVVSPRGPLRDCMILNISDAGARLEMPTTQDLPEEFTMLLAPRGHATRRCRVVWRTDGQMGVMFEGHASPSDPQSDAAIDSI
jgi:hypothetical protein